MSDNDYDSGKATAVKIFMVLSCIACIVEGISSIARLNLVGGIMLLVSLIWVIPMTVYTFRRLNEYKPISTGFKICTLLFHNLIAGIILLCMKTNGKENEADTAAAVTTTTVSEHVTTSRENDTLQTNTQMTALQSTNDDVISFTENKYPNVTSAVKQTTPVHTFTKGSASNQHHWTYYEDELCVKMVIYNFVYHHFHDVSGVVNEIYNHLNGAIKAGSIHMKLSNIKYILLEKNIPNTLDLKPLWQVSKQCKIAFSEVYTEYKSNGCIIDDPIKSPLPDPPLPSPPKQPATLPTYKIKVIMDGTTYYYKMNVNDNNKNLISGRLCYLLATALYRVESKITAEKLKEQYPTAIVQIVDNVSDQTY